MTNESLLALYETTYEPLQLPLASDGCKQQHRSNIKLLSSVVGRAATLADFTDDNIARVCGFVLSRGRSPATANKIRAQLVALWNFAARRGLVSTWPTIRKYREYRREPTAWSKDQLHDLFEACRRVPGWIGPVRAYLWWITLHAVLWDSGLRIGACVQLHYDQIDWERGFLLVRAEQQKDAEDQWFRLHVDTLALLHRIRTERELIFPWPYCACTLWNRYRRILVDAGLPTTRRDKFHRMRRSVASWFEASGGNATELLGHSSRAVTLAYLDKTIIGRTHATDLLFRPNSPPDSPPGPDRAA